MMHLRCGCEDGGDCTKTTVCAIETAVEDAVCEKDEEIERLQFRLETEVSMARRHIDLMRAYINTAKRHLNFDRPDEALDALYAAINATIKTDSADCKQKGRQIERRAQ